VGGRKIGLLEHPLTLGLVSRAKEERPGTFYQAGFPDKVGVRIAMELGL
jgi:hypothetical protein